MQFTVWSPDVDVLVMTAPDVLVQLQDVALPLHSAVLARGSSVLREWVEEFLPQNRPAVSHPSTSSSTPFACSQQPLSSGPLLALPAPLVLPAQQDDPDAWRRVAALLYPDMRAPAVAAVTPSTPATPGSWCHSPTTTPAAPATPDYWGCLPTTPSAAPAPPGWGHSPTTPPTAAPAAGAWSPVTPLSPAALSPTNSFTGSSPSSSSPFLGAGLLQFSPAGPTSMTATSMAGGGAAANTTGHWTPLGATPAAAGCQQLQHDGMDWVGAGGSGLGPAPAAGAAVAPPGGGMVVSSHAQALATWDDVDKVYRLAHKYSMQGILEMCRARVVSAVHETRAAHDEERWAPRPGLTGPQMQARYQARLRQAQAGLSLVDPTDPSYALRWLVLAVQHHDMTLEQAVLSICKAHMPHLARKQWPSTATNALFLRYWEALGHEYTLNHLLKGN